MHVWTSAVCAAVGALVVASTAAAPAVLVLKLEIVAFNNLRHGGAKEEVLSVVVQLHYAQQQLGASQRRLCRELTNRVGKLYSLPKSIQASKSKRGS